MTRIKYSLICLCSITVVAFLLGCKRDAMCESIEQTYAIGVVGQKTGHVGDTIPLTIAFGCRNGCGDFHSLSQRVAGNEITIDIYARYYGCTCSQVAPLKSTTYIFKPTHTGEFLLKFPQSNGTNLIDTLVIN